MVPPQMAVCGVSFASVLSAVGPRLTSLEIRRGFRSRPASLLDPVVPSFHALSFHLDGWPPMREENAGIPHSTLGKRLSGVIIVVTR